MLWLQSFERPDIKITKLKMKRQQIIKLSLSLIGIILAITLAKFYFDPVPDTKSNLRLDQTKKISVINYDSIITSLLLDSTSRFRKTLDTIYLKKKNIHAIKKIKPKSKAKWTIRQK